MWCDQFDRMSRQSSRIFILKVRPSSCSVRQATAFCNFTWSEILNKNRSYQSTHWFWSPQSISWATCCYFFLLFLFLKWEMLFQCGHFSNSYFYYEPQIRHVMLTMKMANKSISSDITKNVQIISWLIAINLIRTKSKEILLTTNEKNNTKISNTFCGIDNFFSSYSSCSYFFLSSLLDKYIWFAE